MCYTNDTSFPWTTHGCLKMYRNPFVLVRRLSMLYWHNVESTVAKFVALGAGSKVTKDWSHEKCPSKTSGQLKLRMQLEVYFNLKEAGWIVALRSKPNAAPPTGKRAGYDFYLGMMKVGTSNIISIAITWRLGLYFSLA